MTHFKSVPLATPVALPGPGRLSRLSRRRAAPWIGAAIVVSLLIHALAFGLFFAAGRRHVALPTKDAEVELLMVEREGTQAASPAPQPAQRPQPAKAPPAKSPPAKPPVTPSATSQPAQPTSAAKPAPDLPKPQVDASGEPVPQPAAEPPLPAADKPQPPSPETPPKDTADTQPTQETQAAKPAEAAQPAPPSDHKAPKIDFSGTGAESNADVIGGHVLPASPDDRYRNMPPPYPVAAAERGEQGDVTVMIHVGADGAATGAEVVESSGYPALDAGALAAVKTWHFHPALQNAQAIPFDFPFRFEFRREWSDKSGP